MEFCKNHNCSACCLNPKIYLTAIDVNNITGNGFYDVYFVTESDGIKTIRTNDDGSCVFFKEELGGCEIYNSRPEQCKLRPNIFTTHDAEPTIDESCKFSQEYSEDKEFNERLTKFKERLQKEVAWRKKTGYF
jgi:Fe-S-cluster containining protein